MTSGVDSMSEREDEMIMSPSLMEFLTAFHGEQPFEIRFVPEIRALGRAISVMRNGGHFYILTDNGIKQKAAFSPKGIEEYINLELYVFAGDYTAPCFTVNSPNFSGMSTCTTTDDDILNGGKINAQFVDLDAPKEIRCDVELLKQWKRKMAKMILEFYLTPSCVVETKHGYHIYWFLTDGTTKMFRHIQMQLIQLFGGDSKCINESRLMRLPGYVHQKDPKNPFHVNVKLWFPERRYTQLDLKALLPSLDEETIRTVLAERNNALPTKFSGTRKARVLYATKDKIKVVNETD
jgi:hypothetical protein